MNVNVELRKLNQKKIGDVNIVQTFNRKLKESKSLLTRVGMKQWHSHKVKISKYKDFLSKDKKLKCV